MKRTTFEAQITKLALFPALTLLIILFLTMVHAQVSTPLTLLVTFIAGIIICYCNITINQKIYFQFRSVSSLLDAMIHGDYTLRASSMSREKSNSAYSELSNAINGLADRLTQQRLDTVESQTLLQMVIDYIDVAILSIDNNEDVNLLNPAAQSLFSDSKMDGSLKHLLNRLSASKKNAKEVIELNIAQDKRKFKVHTEEFYEKGLKHKLIFISDVSLILRDEERNAWKSLVRVISHEINNSLTPISSISQTLSKAISTQVHSEHTFTTIEEGLNIISERADSLNAFVNSYKTIAQLPKPNKESTRVLTLLEKSCALFDSFEIIYPRERDCMLNLDPVQMEQVLINLLKNAIEATQHKHPDGKIEIDWSLDDHQFNLSIYDQGIGISDTNNLFVPFYTTKNQGSGIGLVLCRQILEGHNGSLTLQNRTDHQGCVANIKMTT